MIHPGLQAEVKGYSMFKTDARSELMTSDDVGSKPESPCHVCGGCSYSWGTLAAQGISFVADDASVLAKVFRGGFKLPARCCDNCGNIQIFARIPKAEQ
jgi:hypothetical protein